MELRVLRYFLMVAREENITRAAGLLHVTQPTLSRQLIQLEEELGVKLFHRNKYRITLTEEGLLLKQRAQEIVALSDKAKQELTKSEGTLSGEIAIGCAEARSFSVLAEQIVAFRKLYPRVRFRIYSATADDVKDRMENGLLDMGLLMEPVDIGRYAFIRMPVRERYGVLVRRDSPLAERDAITPEDLVDQPLIVSRQAFSGALLSSWLGRGLDTLNVAATCGLLYNASLMVEEGVGSVLCLDGIINTSGDSPLCFRPLEPGLEVSVYFVWKKYRSFSKAAEKYMEALLAMLKE